MLGFCTFLLLMPVSPVDAFTQGFYQRCDWIPSLKLAASVNDDMQALISKLLSSSSDDDRRQELSEVFETRMSVDNGFAAQFEATLMRMGEEVQTQVRADPETAPPELKQELWALVDMMVQSKVIIKQSQERREN